jgi:hypothetical protein
MTILTNAGASCTLDPGDPRNESEGRQAPYDTDWDGVVPS